MTADTTIDLADNWGATTLTNAEVFGVGDALISWMGMVGQLGHASPASTLDYTRGPMDNVFAYVVRDFVAWTSGRTDTVPGDPEERLREWAAEARLGDEFAERISRAMGRWSA